MLRFLVILFVVEFSGFFGTCLNVYQLTDFDIMADWYGQMNLISVRILDEFNLNLIVRFWRYVF